MDIIQAADKGKTSKTIAEELKTKGIKRRDGKPANLSFVDYLFTQDRFAGSETLQKYYQDSKLHRRVKNTGEFPMYIVENSLPAIIDKDLYERVQKKRADGKYVQWAINKGIELSCFSRKLECGRCGRNFNKGYNNNNRDIVMWFCRGRNHFGSL